MRVSSDFFVSMRQLRFLDDESVMLVDWPCCAEGVVVQFLFPHMDDNGIPSHHSKVKLSNMSRGTPFCRFHGASAFFFLTEIQSAPKIGSLPVLS